jgi:nucleolar complex protein 2
MKKLNSSFVWQVDKKTVKTRAFQEACIYSVVDSWQNIWLTGATPSPFLRCLLFHLFGLEAFAKPLKLTDSGE